MRIGGFQPFTLSDFPGRAAAIVFTQGCNFRCPFCHNRFLWPQTTSVPPAHTATWILEFMTQRKDLDLGVVVTGGEPTLQADLPDFLQDLKRLGIAVKLDTNGSQPEILAGLFDNNLVDYMAMDIKAPLEKYDLLCGLAVDTESICRSIDIITGSGIPHHFRTTFYPQLLTAEDMMILRSVIPSSAKHITQAYSEPEENR